MCNQEKIYGLEITIKGLIEARKYSYCKNKKTITNALRREYNTYYSLIRNDSNLIANNYKLISSYISKEGILK